MLNTFFSILKVVSQIVGVLLIPVWIMIAFFGFLCFIWFLVFKFKYKLTLPPINQIKGKRRSMLYQLFVLVPRRYVLDRFNRDPDQFDPKGIHMFCGEQGCGKTIGCVEMMLRYQKQYPKSKMITNFGVTTEDTELKEWQQLLTYTNGKKGVIVGIDEIQNWFMSGVNKLPEGMLEVATQNRKNCRILCCTAQVFTRVNKGLREQTTLVYNPHTFLKCFTIVIRRKPVFDSEGNVTDMKWRGMYAFVHTDELREAYDTYKVIHTLAKEGFKDPLPQQITNVYVQQPAGKKK